MGRDDGVRDTMSPRLTDSPWFWVYLFGMSGLILLWISAPTWIERQTRWERRRASRSVTEGAATSREAWLTQEEPNTRLEQAARDAAISRWRTLVAVIALLATLGAIGGFGRRMISSKTFEPKDIAISMNDGSQESADANRAARQTTQE